MLEVGDSDVAVADRGERGVGGRGLWCGAFACPVTAGALYAEVLVRPPGVCGVDPKVGEVVELERAGMSQLFFGQMVNARQCTYRLRSVEYAAVRGLELHLQRHSLALAYLGA